MKANVSCLLLVAVAGSCSQPRISSEPGAVRMLKAEQIVIGRVVSVESFGNVFARILNLDDTEKVCMSVYHVIKGRPQSTVCFLQFITEKVELRKYTSSPKLNPGATIISFLDLVGADWRPVYDYERAWLDVECNGRCKAPPLEDTVRGKISEMSLRYLAGRTREETEKSLNAAVLRARLYGEESAIVSGIERLAIAGNIEEQQAACKWLPATRRPTACLKFVVIPE